MTKSKWAPDKSRIRIPYDGEMMTFAEVGALVGLSASQVARLWYARKPIVRTQPLDQKRALLDGEMLTAKEISARTGLAVSTVRSRMRAGMPLVRIPRGPKNTLHMHEGELMTRAELARRIGKTKAFVAYRIARGIPLDAPTRRGRKPYAEELHASVAELLESGERYIGSGAGENGLRWHEDAECLFWHLYCGGDGYGECTLEEIGMLWDISRERVRQIASIALGKIQRAAARGNKDAVNAIEFFRYKSEQRCREPLSHWEQAELQSPGGFL